MNVMMAAREIVTELVREQYGEKCQGERQAGDERERAAIEQGESADEFVPGDGLILCVGCGEVRAGDETSTQREEKQRARNKESSQRRMLRNRSVVRRRNGCGAPIGGVRREDAALWK
jgi:hypothetical protein